MTRHRNGQFKARPAREAVPLLGTDNEVTRAARILSRAAQEAARARRAAYVARHCAQLLASL